MDDSKTARQVLAKKLSAYEIDIETADSAANAIDFLYGNTPDAVFMDYEMPGMDGFQALKIIKSNPRTATIPVMMYTSKEGGIALSQARALGAIGVLPKQMENQGLDVIIEQLHLLPHQRSLVEQFQDAGDSYQAKSLGSIGVEELGNVEYLNRPVNGEEKVEYPEEVLDESVFLLKRQTRIYVKELMAVEKRLTESLAKEVRQLKENFEAVRLQLDKPNAGSKDKKGMPYVVNLLVLLAFGWLIWQNQILDQKISSVSGGGKVDSQFALLKNQIDGLKISLNKQSQVDGEQQTVDDQAASELQYKIEFLNWAANRGTEFNYGENPFNDMRVAWLSELVSQLNKAGFAGVISLKAHYGNFCLKKSATGALTLANGDFRFADCIFSSESSEAGFSQSSYQTLGFANYVNSIVSDKTLPIDIVVEPDEHDEPFQPYPDPYAVKSALSWNKIALQNQRIQVSLYPTVSF